MIIDAHAHIGDFRLEPGDQSHDPVTWENLIARLDDERIDKAVLLPVYNASPEGAPPAMCLLDERMSVRDQVVDAARYADRIIPFGNMDPRWLRNSPATDFGPLLDWFLAHGCKGIGEVTARLPFDDARVVNMFGQIGAKGMLVTIESSGFHAGFYGLQDDPGARRFERLLQEAPQTVIIGHGPGFWAEISPDVTPADKWGYPKGPISHEGALPRLLRRYPNLYADLSAGSGWNAISRDPAYGIAFLNEFQDKLLFGTDTCFADPAARMSQLPYLRQLLADKKLSPEAFAKIAGGNAQKLLGIGG
jgi:uncharacterized protein